MAKLVPVPFLVQKIVILILLKIIKIQSHKGNLDVFENSLYQNKFNKLLLTQND